MTGDKHFSKSLLVFTGPGCMNCKAEKPILDEVLKDYPEIKVYYYDTKALDDETQKVIDEYKPTGLPTLIYVESDWEVDYERRRIVGLKPASVIRRFLDGQN